MFLLDPLTKYDPTLFELKRVGSNPSGAGSKIKWSQEQDDYIRKCYDQQHSVKLLSQLFSTSEETMRNHLKAIGITTLSTYEKGELKRNRDSFFFHEIDTPAKAYWLGFMYADGYVNESRHYIRINLKTDDEFHLSKFLFCLKAMGYPINRQSKILDDKEYYISYFQITDHQLIQDLVAKGCPQAKTFKVCFPDEDILPKELQFHFIRGVLDADGTITYTTKPNSELKFYTVTFLGTQHLIDGIKHCLGYAHLKTCKENNIYALHIGGNVQAYKVLDRLYQDSYYEIELDRKKQLYLELKRQREMKPEYKKEVSHDGSL